MYLQWNIYQTVVVAIPSLGCVTLTCVTYSVTDAQPYGRLLLIVLYKTRYRIGKGMCQKKKSQLFVSYITS